MIRGGLLWRRRRQRLRESCDLSTLRTIAVFWQRVGRHAKRHHPRGVTYGGVDWKQMRRGALRKGLFLMQVADALDLQRLRQGAAWSEKQLLALKDLEGSRNDADLMRHFVAGLFGRRPGADV